MIGINDYSISTSAYTLVVEIKTPDPNTQSHFVMFNKVEGINLNTGEAQNQVTVVKGAASTESWLEKKIAPGGSHSFPDFYNGRALEITVGTEAQDGDINYIPVTIAQEVIPCTADADCRSNLFVCNTASCVSSVCEFSLETNCCGNGSCESNEFCSTCSLDCLYPTNCNEVDGKDDGSIGKFSTASSACTRRRLFASY